MYVYIRVCRSINGILLDYAFLLWKGEWTIYFTTYLFANIQKCIVHLEYTYEYADVDVT